MFTVDVKQQYNKSLRLMSGANFPPIVAWNYKIEWSSACSSFVRFVLNFMLNIEHENVLKSFITSGLCSDSDIVLS